MAATTQGTAHLFGVAGTITNATVQSFEHNDGFALTETTVDENGIAVERRYDDSTQNATIVLRMQAAYTAPSPGDALTYNAVSYEVVSVDQSQSAGSHRTLTLTLIKSESITPS